MAINDNFDQKTAIIYHIKDTQEPLEIKKWFWEET